MPTDFRNNYFAARPIGKFAISVVAEDLTTIKTCRYTTLLFGASVTHSGQRFVVFGSSCGKVSTYTLSLLL